MPTTSQQQIQTIVGLNQWHARMKLETDTHVLQLFKDPLYYTLLEKRHPERAHPERLTSGQTLHIELQEPPESHSARVWLAGKPIGEVQGDQEIDDFAQFVADWRESLATVAVNGERPASSSLSSSSPASGRKNRTRTRLEELGLAVGSTVGGVGLAVGNTVGGVGRAAFGDRRRARNDDPNAFLPRSGSSTPSNSNVTMKDSNSNTSVNAIANVYSNANLSASTSATTSTSQVSVGDVRDAELIAEKNAYMVDSQISMRVITWNTHGEPIHDQDLQPLVTPTPQNKTVHDIVVLFIQESDPLSKNLYANNTTLDRTRKRLLSQLNNGSETNGVEMRRRSDTVSSLDSSSAVSSTKLSPPSSVTSSLTKVNTRQSANTLDSDNNKDENAYNYTDEDNKQDETTTQQPDTYEFVAHNQLLGLMTIVVARKSIAKQISNVHCASTGTGLFGIWGNKGAIIIKFNVGVDEAIQEEGTLVKLVNCHLTAGPSGQSQDRRRWELEEIASKFRIHGLVSSLDKTDALLFDTDAPELVIEEEDEIEDLDADAEEQVEEINEGEQTKSGGSAEAEQAPRQNGSNRLARMQSHSHSTMCPKITIFGGDLNYRLTMDPDVLEDYVERKDFETVLVHDTLSKEIRASRLMTQFSEADITFPPTYKFSIGSKDLYDRDRVPSYTDRIFYQSNEKLITPVEYESFPQYTISDHKPVGLTALVKCKLINFEERHKIVEKALRKLDIAENAARPIVSMDKLEVTLGGPVLTNQSTYLTLTLEAGEQSPLPTTAISGSENLVQWKAVIPEGESRAKAAQGTTGLSLEPREGFLPAGASQQIRLSYDIVAEDKPRDVVIVFRVEDVRDIFVTVHLSPLPTCLGCSLDLLCRMPNGARNGMSDDPPSNMPHEIWNCVDYMWTRIVPDIFWHKGDPSVQNQVLAWMDQGMQFDTEVLDAASKIQPGMGVYSVAQQFLLLLRHLRGGIISADYYYLVVRGAAGVNAILESMTSSHVNVMIYIAGFIAKAVNDGVDRKAVLDLFEPLIIQVPRSKQSSKERASCREFLEALIWNTES